MTLPADGTAVVLHLIEAARAMRKHFPLSEAAREVQVWVDQLHAWVERETEANESPGWEPRTWGELEAGDRVALGGVEAEVESAMVLNWHVDPVKYTYVEGRGRVYQPLEHSITKVRLKGWEPLYDMPTGGEVECRRGPLGQEKDRAAGRRRSGLDEEQAALLEHWATEAALTLAAAGLQPEEIRA